MDEREAYIALNMMEKIGPVGVRSLVSELGSAAAIFDADADHLERARGIGRATVGSILKQRDTLPWQAEISRAGELGVRLVAMTDSEYPEQLLGIHDPPLALYVKGEMLSRDRNSVAVVGTRRPTHYGRESASRLSFQLAKAGMTIVSGLAEGVDTAAHEAALRASGRTVAVVGSGLLNLYPPSNEELAEGIAERGAVISEFPLERKPDKTTFPMRNRIVSGLSKGVLVIEAGPNSGALITSTQALDQGRAVFAVPGRIDSPKASGCNNLIKQGARLVTRVDDILEEFEGLFPSPTKGRRNACSEEAPAHGLSDEEGVLLGPLENGPMSVDALIRSCGLKPAKVNALLMSMEMKRAVRMLPGRQVERIRN